MEDTSHPGPSLSCFALHRIPNGLVVLLTVSLLLQGPAGAFEALWGYTFDLIGTMLGGDELFWQVLCQTAPLAFAAAAIAIAYRSRWLRFSSPVSLLAASVLLLGGTWVGGELRSFSAKERPAAQTGTPIRPAAFRSGTHVVLTDGSLTEVADEMTEVEIISATEAFAKLSDVHGSATDGSHHHWAGRIPPVALLPETDSGLGLIARAINQLAGYFVVYRPRLFIAAILSGIYIGWSWQPYAESVVCWLEKRRRTAAPLRS